MDFDTFEVFSKNEKGEVKIMGEVTPVCLEPRAHLPISPCLVLKIKDSNNETHCMHIPVNTLPAHAQEIITNLIN